MSTYQNGITVRFHEIALKGRNRPFFIRRLVQNLKTATQGMGVDRITRDSLTIMLHLNDHASWPALRGRLQEVFGVAKFSLAYVLPPSLEAVEQLLSQEVTKLSFGSFRITAKRVDKSFPIRSPEMAKRLGEMVRLATGAAVNLTQPELNISVEVRPERALVFFDEVPGPGGLPVGSSGRVACLLSGGIDSPVAAWRMMKRGCQAVFVHFHSFPLVEGTSREKAVELVETLTRFQYRSRLFLVPFADLQKRVILEVPPTHRIIVYRRFMMRIAQELGIHEGAKALVTGESVGQVGSQTLDNIATIHSVTKLPVLTPLIGMDKVEIIESAQKIGTYPISIIPDEDCCSLFVPRSPATRSTQQELEAIEARLDVKALVEDTLKGVEVRDFLFSATSPPVQPMERPAAGQSKA